MIGVVSLNVGEPLASGTPVDADHAAPEDREDAFNRIRVDDFLAFVADVFALCVVGLFLFEAYGANAGVEARGVGVEDYVGGNFTDQHVTDGRGRHVQVQHAALPENTSRYIPNTTGLNYGIFPLTY